MKHPFILYLFTSFLLCSLEQPEARSITLAWQKNYGEQANVLPNVLQNTRDGGYLMAGYRINNQPSKAHNENVWINKTNTEGDIIWDYELGNADREVANNTIELSNGNVMVIGTTHSKGSGKGDIWLLCLNSQGTLQWDATFGGPETDEGQAIIATKDGGFAILGMRMVEDATKSTENKKTYRQSLWLCKTDAMGKLLWEKNFYNGNYNMAKSLIETTDGLFLVGNTMINEKSMDGWLVKTDHEGNMQWNKTYGGLRWDNFQAAILSSDNNLMVVGTSYQQHLDGDAWLLKVDRNGTTLLEKYIDASAYEAAVAVQETANKHLQVVSNVTLPTNESMFMVSYLASNGNEVWTKLFADHNINKITAATRNQAGELVLCADANKGIAPCGEIEGEKNAWLLKFAEEF
ncbi:MAG: hypothetical protein JNM36_18355 [Chitinophagales bacterium]|nr:hypothetical protein [Chitinophagales bacterium]